MSSDTYLTKATTDVSTAHTAAAIPELKQKETFVPNGHQDGMSRNDGLQVKFSIIFCTEL